MRRRVCGDIHEIQMFTVEHLFGRIIGSGCELLRPIQPKICRRNDFHIRNSQPGLPMILRKPATPDHGPFQCA